uniref:Uncharacterized protein n=1 Tax=Neisseria meningitidis alpha275 TaxID=295996 RepID=C6SLY9_NEIME|nr:hypothetical protein predicted by Glimmer/Critica [Neisseria meningitidis alpha275]
MVNIETGVLHDVQAAEKYPLHPIWIIPAWGVFTDSAFQTALVFKCRLKTQNAPVSLF